MSGVSEEDILTFMRPLMETINIDEMTTNQFVDVLSEKMGVDISSEKKFIRNKLKEMVNGIEGESSSNPTEPPTKPFIVEGADGQEVKVKKATGLTAVKEISDEMATFLGQGKQMSRTGVVKALWCYIRDNELQNPEDKREITLDARMQKLFGVEKFSMFAMNKYIGAHVHPFTPVRFDTEEEKEAKRIAREEKKKAKNAKAGKNKKKIKRKAGAQWPYRLSEEMVAVTGVDILPRPQVIQAIWKYIRANNLQNPNDKRTIICDENLKAVMDGNVEVTIFNMAKYISRHMVEKLPKEAYVHPAQEDTKTDLVNEADISNDDE